MMMCSSKNVLVQVVTSIVLFVFVAFFSLAHADEYDGLRSRWSDKLTGGAGVNVVDVDVSAQIAVIVGNATAAQTSMCKPAVGLCSYLWTDYSDWTQSSSITNSYGRIYSMALGYATPGSSLQGNAVLAADIVSALDWLYNNKYNSGIVSFNGSSAYSTSNNWWDWQIGIPQSLTNTMTLMYAQLTPTQIANYLAAIDHFVPDPTRRQTLNGSLLAAPEVGANRLDKALAIALRGVLGKNAVKIAQGRDAVSAALLYVSSGDGVYPDGSFIQHSNVAYTGSYGAVLLDSASRVIYLLSGSSWDFTDPNIVNVYDWVDIVFRPFIYDGAMMDSVRGRAIARQFSSDHSAGRSTIVSLVRLAQGAPSGKAASINAMIKGWMQRDGSFGSNYFIATPTAVAGVYSGLPLYELGLLKALLTNSAIVASPEPVQTFVYSGMARAVQRESGFGLSLSLSSDRISAFEFGGGENSKGWWTGMGVRTLYNTDQTQYDNNFWPTVDAGRLPGTTTDRSGSGLPKAYTNYFNCALNSLPTPTCQPTWVGGAELGARYAAVGSELFARGVTGSSLKALKSWFLFGDKIVEVGAGINSIDNVNIETIVDNRKLNTNGDNVLTVNGLTKPASMGWSETMSAVSWAHLAGSVPGSDIGYYWPGTATVYGLRESRTSNWSAINSNPPPTPDVSNSYLSLATSQGANPAGATYAHVILPNRSAGQTAAYALNPTVTILEQSVTATAVRDSALGLVGANFWTDASKTVNVNGAAYLTSDHKASVLTQEVGNQLVISVADPTQSNTGVINIEISRSAGTVISSDAGVTVTQLSPTIKLSVNVNAAAGRSFVATFQLIQTISLIAQADASVRDGSYANTNYGASSILEVKNDALGYARQSYLKFDMSAITGNIVSAKLMLAPCAVGQTSTMVNNLYAVPDNSWIETALTWNNKPLIGTALGSWNVPAVGSYVALDVTNQVIAVMAGSKILSTRLEAAANYGANGWVQYASRERATNKPTLVLTYY